MKPIKIKKRSGVVLHDLPLLIPSTDLKVDIYEIDKWYREEIKNWKSRILYKSDLEERLKKLTRFYFYYFKHIQKTERKEREHIFGVRLFELDQILKDASKKICEFKKYKDQRRALQEMYHHTNSNRYKSMSFNSIKNKIKGPIFLDNPTYKNRLLDLNKLLSREEMLLQIEWALKRADHWVKDLFPTEKITSYSETLISTAYKMAYMDVLSGKGYRQVLNEETEIMLGVFWGTGIDEKEITYGAYRKKVSKQRYARIYPFDHNGRSLNRERIQESFLEASGKTDKEEEEIEILNAFCLQNLFPLPSEIELNNMFLFNKHIYKVYSQMMRGFYQVF